MIEINLLPVREWRRREAVRRQISVYILSLVLLAAILGAVGYTFQSQVSTQKSELKKLQKRRSQLAYVNKRIQTLNTKRKAIESKFSAIEKLQTGRTFTVQVIDEVVSAIPIDRLWLTKLNFNGSRIQLRGIALDNHTVALFMRRLENSPLCTSVRLSNTKTKQFQGHSLKEFGLDAQFRQPAAVTAKKKG